MNMQYSQIFFVVTTTTTTTTTAAATTTTIKHDKRPKIDTNKDIKSNQRQREKGKGKKKGRCSRSGEKEKKKEEASQNSALSLDELSPCSYDPSVDKLHDLLPYTWVLHMLL